MARDTEHSQMLPTEGGLRVIVLRRIPETGFLRLHQIIGCPARNGKPAIPAIIPVSRSTWWAGVKSGRYPQPVRSLGQRITAWRVEDILRLLDEAGEAGRQPIRHRSLDP
ncbi:helix-turn-helix transcriptional regulator [Luteimonas marina]|nr:hypothetical protein [Luteimonas marina]